MKSRKRERMGGIELPNQESVTKLGEKVNYKFLGNIKSRHHLTNGDERKNNKYAV